MTSPRSLRRSMNRSGVCAPPRVRSAPAPPDAAPPLIGRAKNPPGRLPPAPIRVDRLYFLPSQSRGPEIVKLEVGPSPALEKDVDELLAALRRCGVPSLYPTDRAKPTITTLQRVTRRDAVEPDVSGLPLELFTADLLIVSRIAGLARYEILDSASIPASG